MPTALRSGPYRVHFFSHEPNEPAHVLDRDDLSAKFWLQPVALARNFGFAPHELRGVQELIERNRKKLLEAWHGYPGTSADERVRDVRVSDDTLRVDLMDGRTISVSLVWYPRLLAGTRKQREHWQPCAAGYGIH